MKIIYIFLCTNRCHLDHSSQAALRSNLKATMNRIMTNLVTTRVQACFWPPETHSHSAGWNTFPLGTEIDAISFARRGYVGLMNWELS